jgi:hypothetical protein
MPPSWQGAAPPMMKAYRDFSGFLLFKKFRSRGVTFAPAARLPLQTFGQLHSSLLGEPRWTRFTFTVAGG